MRIGILGGSFDPPHFGHIQMAELCEEFLELEKIIFTPANLQWQKNHESSADVRAHMTNLAISNHPNWQVSYVDLDRDGKTYSIDTYKDLKKIYPDDELIFILGSDAANGLATWHKANELKTEVTFAVVKRHGIDVAVPPEYKHMIVPGSVIDISSTKIRDLVKNSENVEKDLESFLPSIVAKYIAQVGLYK